MRAFFIILWCTLGVLAGTALFHTSEEVQKSREETARLESQIAEEKESLRVLKAEWAYLNQPERLEKLASEHLDLVPTKGRQLATLGDVPQKQTDTDADTNPLIAQETAPLKNHGIAQKLTTDYAPARQVRPATPNALPTSVAPAPVVAQDRRILPSKAEAPRDFGALLQSLGGN